MTPGEFVEKVIALIGEDQGRLSIVRNDTTPEPAPEWMVALEFGREAPDSPMYGGATYGVAETLPEAIDQVAGEMGWL